MSQLLNRMGQWSFHNRFKSLFIWVIILVAFVLGVGKLGSNYDQNLKINGLPSTNIQSTLQKEFHQNANAGTMKVVIKNTQKNGVAQSSIKQKINSAIKDAKKDDHGIKSITNPYSSQIISKDKSTTYVDITFKRDAHLVTQSQIKSAQRAFNKIAKHADTKVAYSGTVEITPFNIGGASEVIGIVIAFILLMILFRSFITAGLPIISAIVGLIAGVLLITIGTSVFSIVNIAQTLATMLSLAVGIDYALFIVHRYRGELKTKDPKQAMGTALATAGSSVLFAGITVIIAVAGLSIVGIDFLTQMGLAAAVGVAFAILSALTFLPALISLLHRFIKADQSDPEAVSKNPGLFVKAIVNHPIVSSLVSVVILLGFAIPATNMRLGMPYNGSLPTNNTERQAYDIVSDKFGEGINAPLIGVIKLDSGQSQSEQKQTLHKIANHIKTLDGAKMIVPVVNQKAVKEMKSPQYQAAAKQKITAAIQQQVAMAMQKNPSMTQAQQQAMVKQLTAQYTAKAKAEAKARAISSLPMQISSDHKYAMFILIPEKGTEAVQTERLTKQINSYSKQVQKSDHTKITLTGTNAVNIDTTNKLNKVTPVFSAIVIALAFILLMFMFKSFLIPLVAMAGFGLSLLASFGFTTLTIQEGVLKNVFGISKGAPILSFLPVIFIGILFGLAMDYEVFMVSRTREEFIKTGDNKHAISVGIKSSGPVIVTAALIMIAVFGSFAMSTNVTIKSLGLSLAFGIFFDAFLVRLVLVPAMIRLFGKANWYFPGQNKTKK